jgi:hypothetical protein
MLEQQVELWARVKAATSTLMAAIAVASAGDRQGARELCAATLFEMQPLLPRNRELLRSLLHALVVSHGFKLLSRLVMALTGRRLRILLLANPEGAIGPPRCQEEMTDTICPIDPRWLVRLTADDPFLRRWCEALMAGLSIPTGAVGAETALVGPAPA